MGTATVWKHEVRLTSEQRARLTGLTRTGGAAARTITHARILLLADRAHPDGRRPDEYIAEGLGTHVNTIKRVRTRLLPAGAQPALERRHRAEPPVPAKIDGRAEAHLVALCRSPPPQGHKRWSLTLLARELPRRGVVTEVCRQTVRKALKKMNLSL